MNDAPVTTTDTFDQAMWLASAAAVDAALGVVTPKWTVRAADGDWAGTVANPDHGARETR